jgi:hypothetical protein
MTEVAETGSAGGSGEPADPPRTDLAHLLGRRGPEFVVTCYHVLLGRAPDPEGLRHYVGLLMAGAPRLQIIDSLCRSREGRSRRAIVAGLQGARRAYHLSRWPGLGRLLRPLLLAWYPVGVVYDAGTSQTPSLGDLLALRDERLVQQAYKTLLHRPPDAPGLAHYLRLLHAGRHPIDVLGQIRRSAEGQRAAVALGGLNGAYALQRWARRLGLQSFFAPRPHAWPPIASPDAHHAFPEQFTGLPEASLPQELGYGHPESVRLAYRDLVRARTVRAAAWAGIRGSAPGADN